MTEARVSPRKVRLTDLTGKQAHLLNYSFPRYRTEATHVKGQHPPMKPLHKAVKDVSKSPKLTTRLRAKSE